MGQANYYCAGFRPTVAPVDDSSVPHDAQCWFGLPCLYASACCVGVCARVCIWDMRDCTKYGLCLVPFKNAKRPPPRSSFGMFLFVPTPKQMLPAKRQFLRKLVLFATSRLTCLNQRVRESGHSLVFTNTDTFASEREKRAVGRSRQFGHGSNPVPPVNIPIPHKNRF